MASTAGTNLLQASLTGELPSSVEQACTAEREKGNQAYKEARYEDAIQHYTEAEIINPLSPLPPANRAMVYLKMEKWQQARDEAAVALELQNALPVHLHSQSLTIKLLLRRATACKQLMLFALAVEDYQAVLNLDPRHAVAQTEFDHLSLKYRVEPSASVSRPPINPLPSASARGGNTSAGRIRVMSEKSTTSVSDTTTARKARTARVAPRAPARDEAKLFMLPKDIMKELTEECADTPPDTCAQFEHSWRSLHSDAFAQGIYLVRTVGARRIRSGLIGDSLTAQTIERVGHVLAIVVSHDSALSAAAADILLAFVSVSRFELLMMFLSVDERRPFTLLIDQLRRNGIDESFLLRLEQSYLTACN